MKRPVSLVTDMLFTFRKSITDMNPPLCPDVSGFNIPIPLRFAFGIGVSQ